MANSGPHDKQARNISDASLPTSRRFHPLLAGSAMQHVMQ
jgi:hypothetical protein